MRLISNTAISLDGRTGLADAPRFRVGSRADLARMRALRATVDAVLVGGETFRTWPLALAAVPARPLLMAVLTRSGVLEAAPRWRSDPTVQLVVLGGPDLDVAAHEQAFGADLELCERPSLAWALERLEVRGCERVLLEGGGRLIHDALAEGVLDELHITLCPLVLGGDAPSLVDGPRLPAGLRELELVDMAVVSNEVVLRYVRRTAGECPDTGVGSPDG